VGSTAESLWGTHTGSPLIGASLWSSGHEKDPRGRGRGPKALPGASPLLLLPRPSPRPLGVWPATNPPALRRTPPPPGHPHAPTHPQIIEEMTEKAMRKDMGAAGGRYSIM
jgi:hypothetical protein